MQTPQLGRVFATNDGKHWCVSEVSTAADLNDPEVDPGFFLIVLVEGTDPEDLDADSVEFTDTEFQDWCEMHQITV